MDNIFKYNVGMYGGCFDPLHTGHLSVLYRAASECELYAKLKTLHLSRHVSVKKVLICGTESTGKSTLTQLLANKYCTTAISEYGRAIEITELIDDILAKCKKDKIKLQSTAMIRINAMKTACQAYVDYVDIFI